MVDVSLAGCCGVQSSHGGLVITSTYIPDPAGDSPPRPTSPRTEQQPLRAERSARPRVDSGQLSFGQMDPEDPFEARGSLLDGDSELSEHRGRRWAKPPWT
jgi:hypothetical protein